MRPWARTGGKLADREFRSLVAAPLKSRDSLLGFVAVLDKEARGAGEPGFSDGDRRFLRSVAALAGVAVDGLRQVERLVVSRERLAEENKVLKERLDDLAEVGGQRIVAYAPAMRRILEVIDRVAPRSVSVLLRGESGTGKELMAALLHRRSERSGTAGGSQLRRPPGEPAGERAVRHRGRRGDRCACSPGPF